MEYIPNFDGLMRSTLRDTIARLRQIRVKAGKQDEDAEAVSTGDPFQDLDNAFIRVATRVRNNINERNRSCRKYGQDRIAITQSNEIRKDIHQMQMLLDEMKEHVDKAESLLNSAKKKKHKQLKIDILEHNLKEKQLQYNNCIIFLNTIRDLDSERLSAQTDGINLGKETQLGKRMELRQKLLDMHFENTASNSYNGEAEKGDGLVGGGKLEEHKDTKHQMEMINAQDAKINAGLSRLREGVGRLHNLAVEIGTQLSLQDEIQIKTEKQITTQSARLQNLNKRLARLIKQRKPMNCCINLFCGILILAVLGFILVELHIL